MNYTDVALTGSQIEELKKDFKKTAWRVKALKATGKKLPDTDTTNIVKIDGGDNSQYDYNTDGTGYKRIIHDPDMNRTFVLENETPFTDPATVSIINHYLGEDHDDFIETLDRDTHDDDWDENTAYLLCDMDYDQETKTLAIATMGTNETTAGLLLVDCAKYLPELTYNVCAELTPNPDYLKARFITPGESYFACWGSYIRFVRRYQNRWYFWAKGAEGRVNSGGDVWSYHDKYNVYYLGYLTDAGAFTKLMQYGNCPTDEGFAEDTRWPNAPVWYYGGQIGHTPFGEVARIFENIESFEITESGKLIMATATNAQEYGMEPWITRIDLAKAENPPSLLGSCQITAGSVWDEGKQKFVTDVGEDETSTVTLNVPGARGCVTVRMSYDQTGYDHGRSMMPVVQNRFGTSRILYYYDDDLNLYANTSVFAYDETLKFGIPRIAVETDVPHTLCWTFSVYSICEGLEECIGVHSTGGPVIHPDDDILPATAAYDWYDYDWQVAERVDPDPDLHPIRVPSCIYDSDRDSYYLAVQDQVQNGIGYWIYDSGAASGALTRLTADNSDLAYNRVGDAIEIGDNYIALVCDDSVNSQNGNNSRVQFMHKGSLSFAETSYHADLIYSSSESVAVIYDEERSVVGMATGAHSDASPNSFNGPGEIWFWKPETLEGEWIRDPRVWWNGNNPDIIIGDSAASAADSFGQGPRLLNPSWAQTKGLSSYRFSFDTSGFEYLPWAESPFNENDDLPGSYDGTLQDGTRLIVERGVWDGAQWNWIQEGQTFVMSLPVNNTSGDISMSVTSQGAISMLVQRSTYDGFHKPDVTTVQDAALTAGTSGENHFPYYYESGGEKVTNWAVNPQPVVKVDGEAATTCTINSFSGEVVFREEPAGDVTATFDYYEPGTNEAEDIIWCILTYPQEFGGCELDESWFTRELEDVELEHLGGGVFAFPKNNIVPDYANNQVRCNGGNVAVVWNWRDGTVEYAGWQAGDTLTGDCAYFTIQKGGVTLPPLNLSVRDDWNSYKCIDKVCEHVSPNYIFREGRDGKLECDYFTQKPAGEEDIVIDDDDIAIHSFNSNPAYEELATRVVSIGSGKLEELPNHCLNKEVTDLFTAEVASRGWGSSWANPQEMNSITDGNPATGVHAGWGGNDGFGPITGSLGGIPDGVPLLSIDMEQEYEIDTVIVARLSQRSNEGARDPNNVQQLSVWVKQDRGGADYVRLVEPFKIMPGANVKFTAGVNYDVGTRFRWIRVNLHAIGLYHWKHQIDSQIGISEVQCYPHRLILGEARLQSEDPAADLYDEHGLLDKYGYITHVARGGTPASNLNSKEKADTDAAHTLKEIVRLMRKVDISSPWLPGIPAFSTVKVTNTAMGITRTFFVEGRRAGPGGDNYTGATLP